MFYPHGKMKCQIKVEHKSVKSNFKTANVDP